MRRPEPDYRSAPGDVISSPPTGPGIAPDPTLSGRGDRTSNPVPTFGTPRIDDHQNTPQGIRGRRLQGEVEPDLNRHGRRSRSRGRRRVSTDMVREGTIIPRWMRDILRAPGESGSHGNPGVSEGANRDTPGQALLVNAMGQRIRPPPTYSEPSVKYRRHQIGGRQPVLVDLTERPEAGTATGQMSSPSRGISSLEVVTGSFSNASNEVNPNRAGMHESSETAAHETHGAGRLDGDRRGVPASTPAAQPRGHEPKG